MGNCLLLLTVFSKTYMAPRGCVGGEEGGQAATGCNVKRKGAAKEGEEAESSKSGGAIACSKTSPSGKARRDCSPDFPARSGRSVIASGKCGSHDTLVDHKSNSELNVFSSW